MTMQMTVPTPSRAQNLILKLTLMPDTDPYLIGASKYNELTDNAIKYTQAHRWTIQLPRVYSTGKTTCQQRIQVKS